jgi:peroxiredoxin
MTSETRARYAVGVLAAVVLAGSGCAGPDTPQAQPAPAATGATATSLPPASPAVTTPVADSLRFTAKTIDGAPFDGATLAGRPVVLWFWAAWCSRCRAKAPDVAAIQREQAGKLTVVGVAGLNSGDAAMKKFATDTAITGFVNLADDKGEIWRKFGVTTQEFFVLIDRDGAVVHKGSLSAADLRGRAPALTG